MMGLLGRIFAWLWSWLPWAKRSNRPAVTKGGKSSEERELTLPDVPNDDPEVEDQDQKRQRQSSKAEVSDSQVWLQEKRLLLSLPLEEKREYYACKNKYVTLADVQTWTEYFTNDESFLTALGELRPINVDVKYDVNPQLNEKISIWKGDITALEIDAIVNAANKALLGGGGVDGAIHRAAGKHLVDECATLNGCNTGEAKITGGFCLPAKYVIHTVGPIGRGNAELKSCYRMSLDLMIENGLKSIAFPCISTGIYGFPNERAANIVLKTAREFLEEYQEQVERIILCLFMPVDIELYQKLMSVYFPVRDPPKAPKEEELVDLSGNVMPVSGAADAIETKGNDEDEAVGNECINDENKTGKVADVNRDETADVKDVEDSEAAQRDEETARGPKDDDVRGEVETVQQEAKEEVKSVSNESREDVAVIEEGNVPEADAVEQSESGPAPPAEGDADMSVPAPPAEGDADMSGPASTVEGDADMSSPASTVEGDADMSGPASNVEGDPDTSGPAPPAEGDPDTSGLAPPAEDDADKSSPDPAKEGNADKDSPAPTAEGDSDTSSHAPTAEGDADKSGHASTVNQSESFIHIDDDVANGSGDAKQSTEFLDQESDKPRETVGDAVEKTLMGGEKHLTDADVTLRSDNVNGSGDHDYAEKMPVSTP